MKRQPFSLFRSIFKLSLLVILVFSCETPNDSNTMLNDLKPTEFELNEMTVDQLQAKMEDGTYTARQITELYLDRIKAIDQDGPGLNSVIEINPDALTIADQMDEERNNGNVRGPLHGIPIMIKDNIDTGDKMMTTAGSLALEGNIVSEDAFIVSKIRAAGAILLGKTNLSEWANFRSTNSSSGWSSRGGQTNNPYALNRNPCGSSSGSGVAVSANLCMLTIGTETDGSIVCPSSTNGVAGIKPTIGLISRSGIIPISDTQDTAGPMARTLRDAAIFLGTLTGIDNNDAKSVLSENKSYTDYTQFLDVNGLNGARIGVVKGISFHKDVDKLMEVAKNLMEEKGATLIEVERPENYGELGNFEYEVLKYEFKDGLNKYLAKASTNAKVENLEDVIAFNLANEAKAMPYFKQEILEMSQEKEGLESEAYKEAVSRSVGDMRAWFDKTMNGNQLDALIAPTTSAPWCTDIVNGDHYLGGSSSLGAMPGYPIVCVPLGFVHGLPVGISFFGEAWSEPRLLKVAYGYEQSSNHRKAPEFKEKL